MCSSDLNNGKKEVPSILLEPIVVDKSNVLQTVVKDGYQKLEDIYRNVPREQWPKPTASLPRRNEYSLGMWFCFLLLSDGL